MDDWSSQDESDEWSVGSSRDSGFDDEDHDSSAASPAERVALIHSQFAVGNFIYACKETIQFCREFDDQHDQERKYFELLVTPGFVTGMTDMINHRECTSDIRRLGMKSFVFLVGGHATKIANSNLIRTLLNWIFDSNIGVASETSKVIQALMNTGNDEIKNAFVQLDFIRTIEYFFHINFRGFDEALQVLSEDDDNALEIETVFWSLGSALGQLWSVDLTDDQLNIVIHHFRLLIDRPQDRITSVVMDNMRSWFKKPELARKLLKTLVVTVITRMKTESWRTSKGSYRCFNHGLEIIRTLLTYYATENKDIAEETFTQVHAIWPFPDLFKYILRESNRKLDAVLTIKIIRDLFADSTVSLGLVPGILNFLRLCIMDSKTTHDYFPIFELRETMEHLLFIIKLKAWESEEIEVWLIHGLVSLCLDIIRLFGSAKDMQMYALDMMYTLLTGKYSGHVLPFVTKHDSGLDVFYSVIGHQNDEVKEAALKVLQLLGIQSAKKAQDENDMEKLMARMSCFH